MNRTGRAILSLGLIALLAACGGDDPTGLGDTDLDGGTMTATLDGNPWTASFVIGTMPGGIISFAGTDLANITIGMAWFSSGTGTYDFGTSIGANGSITDNSGNTWSVSNALGSGSITVTAVDADSVTGTFTFTAERTSGSGAPLTRTVSGSFDVELTVPVAPHPLRVAALHP